MRARKLTGIGPTWQFDRGNRAFLRSWIEDRFWLQVRMVLTMDDTLVASYRVLSDFVA